uniref:Uncharacterized protein n=1 Tax=Fusarium oxysporum (strain Fo5176) TaxID=660025 RepID=A0A0D2YBE6_FUSOF
MTPDYGFSAQATSCQCRISDSCREYDNVESVVPLIPAHWVILKIGASLVDEVLWRRQVASPSMKKNACLHNVGICSDIISFRAKSRTFFRSASVDLASYAIRTRFASEHKFHCVMKWRESLFRFVWCPCKSWVCFKEILERIYINNVPVIEEC